MTRSRKSPLGHLLQTRRDGAGALFVVLSVIVAFLPPAAFAVLAGIEALALILALGEARRLVPAERSSISLLGHITAVTGAVLVCVFFMARYMGYIGFAPHATASVLLILALAFLLPLRRPVH